MLISSDQKKNAVTTYRPPGYGTTFTVPHLEKCASYYFAVALNNSKLEREKNLYLSTELLTTGGEKTPMVPTGVKILNNEVLMWKEDDVSSNKCFKRYQLIERNVCTQGEGGTTGKYGIAG